MYRSKLRPLNSNLRACVAHHKVLDSTLGPPCTTQRPLFNSTRRIWTAPRVALENTIGPSRVTQRPMNSTGEHHWAPYCHRETIEQYPESQQVPSPGTGDPYRTPEYHSATQRPSKNTMRACTSPHVALETTPGPPLSVRNH